MPSQWSVPRIAAVTRGPSQGAPRVGAGGPGTGTGPPRLKNGERLKTGERPGTENRFRAFRHGGR